VQELTSGSPVANILSGIAVDEWLTRIDSGGARHFLVDALGSTVALANGSGTVLTEYTAEPFGETAASGSSSSNAFQFTGRENDGDGLYYYRARYYAVSMARFLSEDPLGERGGINPYAYVGNQPTAYIDPQGLLQLCCRPVNMPGLRQMGARHCFLRLSDGTTLGGYNRFPRLVPEPNNPDDKCPNDTPECRELPGNEPDVRRAWDSLPTRYRIYGIDGTSNAIPFEVLDRAGIPYTVPDGAWGGRPVPFVVDMPLYIP
jgi:RHS repeat-associated protein